MNAFQKVSAVLFLFYIFIPPIFVKEIQRCEYLTHPSLNVEVKCLNVTGTRAGNSSVTCIYKCRPYYIPYENTEQKEREIRCGLDGKWTDIQQFKAFTCKEDCGRRLTNPKAFIVHGVKTNVTSWPWHAALFRRQPGTSAWIYICGGSLIRDSVIITAAHCVTVDKQSLNPDLFRVVLGGSTSNYSLLQNSHYAQTFEIRRIYVSESFDPKKELQADIALMHLGGNGVQFNDQVLPACLPNEYALDVNAVRPGRFGDVVGFGVDESGKASQILKHARLSVASQSECFNNLKRVLSESQFCAGNKREGEKWETVCNGDSGGGLVFPSSVLQRYFIHGIVSSGDSAKIQGSVCQNFAVFTRVFQFIFWIRDILEQINGEQIRELKMSSKYPYVQIGSETLPGYLSVFPREWDNLISSIQLLYYDLKPETLYQSLEHNRGIEFLNLSHVRFTESLQGRRAVLPNLKSFTLDLREFNCSIGVMEAQDTAACLQKDPTRLSRTFIKSLIFFDKYESGWPMAEISHLRTNIELTVHTAKLLILDYSKGKLVCHLRFCSEILASLSPELPLRHLALRNCELNLLNLRQLPTAELRSLVLDSVTLKGGGLSEFIRGMKTLEDLRVTEGVGMGDSENISESEEMEIESKSNLVGNGPINLAHLPPSLKYLSVTRSRIELSSPGGLKSRSNQFKITFPGDSSEDLRNRQQQPILNLPKLHTFFCNACHLSKDVLNNFELVFMNVRRLIFFGDQALNLPKLTTSLPNLELIVLADIGSAEEEDLDDKLSGFSGLEKFKSFFGNGSADLSTKLVLSKRQGVWVKSALTRRAELLSFLYTGMGSFWISFEEFETNSRLSSFEKSAYNSENYTFGPVEPSGSMFPRLPRIPNAIATQLRTIHIRNAEVIPNELLDSLTSALEIQTLVLHNVRLLGYFVNFVELPNLHTYKLTAVSNPDYRFDQTSTKYGAEFFVPFSRSPEGVQKIGSSRFDYLAGTQLSPSMRVVDITFDNCKLLFLDYQAGELVYTPKVASEILPRLQDTRLKKISLRLAASEVNTLSIPSTVQDLNLQCKSEYEWHWNCSSITSRILNRLQALRELRLSLHHVYEEHDALDRNNGFNLSDLKGSARRLEFLGLEEAHLEYSGNLVFPNLKTLLLDTCTFDETVVKKFGDIFQVSTLGVLGDGYEKYGDVLKRKYSRNNDIILLKALKTEKVVRVLGSLTPFEERGFINSSPEDKQSSEEAELRQRLTEAGVPKENTKQFILERRNGRWVSALSTATEGSRNAYKEAFDLEVAKLRGDFTFGTGNCISRQFSF